MRDALIRNEINSLVQSKEFLIRNKLDTAEKFQEHYSVIAKEFDKTADSQRNTRNEILDIEMRIKQLQNYREGINAYKEFRGTKNKLDFVKDEEKYLQKINYEAAKKYFDKIAKQNSDEMSLDDLMRKRDQLKYLAETYPDKREKLFQTKKKLEVVASNIKSSLGIDLTESGDTVQEHKNDLMKKEEISFNLSHFIGKNNKKFVM